MGLNSSFWRDRKVFLTGHTGFKGSWLTIGLSWLGARTTGFSLPPPTEPSLHYLAGLDRRIPGTKGDVRDLDALRQALHKAEPEIVIHMAAQSLVRPSYKDPVGTFATNVMGTVHLLEGVRHTPSVRVVIVVTSDKCYENREWVWGARERDPMGGDDPYSSSKGCAELVTHAYRHSFFHGGSLNNTAVASVRAGNVIGGGDWADDRLIPDIIRAFLANQPVVVRCPTAVRPWHYVLEPLIGYLQLAEKLWEDPVPYLGGWNFGPAMENTLNVESIVRRVASLWGEGRQWQTQSGEHPHEANQLRLDCSKAMFHLGWSPRWPLEKGLAATVEWYRRQNRGEDAFELSVEQLERYMREGKE